MKMKTYFAIKLVYTDNFTKLFRPTELSILPKKQALFIEYQKEIHEVGVRAFSNAGPSPEWTVATLTRID